MSSLQQDVADVSSALADTASALRLSEKQLQTALESKASDVAELEALISRMQAAHKAENDQSAALLAAQAKGEDCRGHFVMIAAFTTHHIRFC